MKYLKLAFVSIVLLFALLTGMSALMPSNVLVSRAVNISASKDTIASYLQNIQQWKRWMEGMNNPDVKVYDSVQANLAGTKVTILQITDSTIFTVWKSKDGNEQTATFHLIAAPTQNLTIVQWQFEQKLSWYPWEKLGSIMNDKIMGTMMEKNLNNLKRTIEK